MVQVKNSNTSEPENDKQQKRKSTNSSLVDLTAAAKSLTGNTVKPLIERHPVFSKIAVSDLLTRIPLRLLSLLQRSIFSCFFFFYFMLMLMLKEGFRVSFTAKKNRLRRLLEETGWR